MSSARRVPFGCFVLTAVFTFSRGAFGDAGVPDSGAEEAGDAGPGSSVIAECPVSAVGTPCPGGECIAATCDDPSSSAPPRACAVCASEQSLGGPYCPAGAACGDGGTCQVLGGAGGQPAIGPDGGAESVYYDLTACRLPQPAPAGGSDDCPSGRYNESGACLPGGSPTWSCDLVGVPSGPHEIAIAGLALATVVVLRGRRRNRGRSRCAP